MDICEQDRHKTGFICHAGIFQCVWMKFGFLTNGPACFQQYLEIILTKYNWKTCLVYLEDVLIFSKNVHDHIRHVDKSSPRSTRSAWLWISIRATSSNFKSSNSVTWSSRVKSRWEDELLVPQTVEATHQQYITNIVLRLLKRLPTLHR